MLVFFHDPTCGRCRKAEGFMAQVLQHRSNHKTFRLRRVDVDKRPDLSERFRVSAVPTLVVVEGGSAKAHLAKPQGCTDIKKLLSPWLK
jgi:thioredoxin-like negative regulator of GroEL